MPTFIGSQSRMLTGGRRNGLVLPHFDETVMDQSGQVLCIRRRNPQLRFALVSSH
jgi:hypothetical protein